MRGVLGVVVLAVVACSGGGGPRSRCAEGSLGVEPEVCGDRSELTFSTEMGGGTFLGTRPIDSVRLSNRGTKPLEITAVTVEGDPEFKVTSTWGGSAEGSAIPPTSVPGGQRVFLRVEFAPRAGKAYFGSFTVETNAPGVSRHTVRMTGCGVLPDGGASTCYACDVLAQACPPQLDGGSRTCYLTREGETFCSFETGAKRLGDLCEARTDCGKGLSCLPPRPGPELRCSEVCARDGGTCNGGKACQVRCGIDETWCGDECVELASADPRNCGACGVRCGSTQSCRPVSDGGLRCLDECAPGQGRCDGGVCIDFTAPARGQRPAPTTDEHCGGCNVRCAANERCQDGLCVRGACAAPQSVCRGFAPDGGDACLDLRLSKANCGRCGNVCEGPCVDGKCQPPSAFNVCAL